MEYKILSGIKSPDDIRELDCAHIKQLCAEIRGCIIDTVSKNGGHLASNLGAVELTVALHRTFHAPNDAIIFDVGHQSYTHKLLTGRFDRFDTLRTEGGISGFMRPEESEYDPFVTGHSSNSISAAYGIYKAKRLRGEDGTAVAVIGDGALTGGLAYEALNNSGSGHSNFIVVLNDNKMSISRNVGALSRSLTKMRSKPRYHHFKFALHRGILKIPLIGKPIFRMLDGIKEYIKGIVYRNNIFVSMGFNYLGPVDGHDVSAMEALFKIATVYNRPTIIHVVTTKGKGYPYAESSPKSYHGVPAFDIGEGASASGNTTYSDVAGEELCRLASEDERVCAVTAAMATGTGLSRFSSEYKTRFFDVGIAEQHAVTFSAGLAAGGMKPYFAVYSTFLQRGYDQLIHDVAIEGLPVRLLVDRAGVVGEDGESHQGLFDVSFLTDVPGIKIYSPACFDELRQVIGESARSEEFCAIRYPRGSENKNWTDDISGAFSVISHGTKRAVITYGRLFSSAVSAAAAVETDLIKLNRIYPLDEEFFDTISRYDELFFFEEAIESGSISEKTAAGLEIRGYKGSFTAKTVGNSFVASASVTASLKKCGLDAQSMIDCLKSR